MSPISVTNLHRGRGPRKNEENYTNSATVRADLDDSAGSGESDVSYDHDIHSKVSASSEIAVRKNGIVDGEVNTSLTPLEWWLVQSGMVWFVVCCSECGADKYSHHTKQMCTSDHPERNRKVINNSSLMAPMITLQARALTDTRWISVLHSSTMISTRRGNQSNHPTITKCTSSPVTKDPGRTRNVDVD